MLLVVGAGGVGRAVAHRLHERGIEVGLLHHPHQRVEAAFPCWSEMESIPFAEVEGAFLCVKDSQIRSVAERLSSYLPSEAVVIHTAGSVPLSVLSGIFGERCGVVYPLQSFIQGQAVEWGSFPIFWEGHPQARLWAVALAQREESVYEASSEARLRLHIGAVFTANFLNALFQMAHTVVGPEWDWRIYLPLARTIISRLHENSPLLLQTGPARRGDVATVAKHLAYLAHRHPDLGEIYQKVSAYIQQHF
ncbi:MAG: DUF2520 domain-containing protein [Bacteroidia bacterium]|nr:DUF2520 domain-containing protein [Bacteroidia bacterium]MDW8014858.1 DUF2520 domain-containing protein [Bacteroidia bacterium]